MDVFVCLGLLLISIFAAMLFSIPLPWALFVGYIGLAAATRRRGFSFGALLKMTGNGIHSSAVVLKVLLCIGILTALWRAGGTLPLLVYEGVRFIHPQWFVLCAFLFSAFVSFLIGSSFGTAGTMGVGLMILGNAGGGNPLLIAGAIMSGIYFGDRCSPASSCASLVAALTSTRLYDNVAGMMKSALVPCLVTTGLYAALSPLFSLKTLGDSAEAVLRDISTLFSLHPAEALPAALILLLPLFKVGIKTTMAVSSLCAAFCAIFLEKMPFLLLLKTVFWGYVPGETGAFAEVIQGGGLWSMLNVMLIILISSAYSGIFQETKMLEGIETALLRLTKRIGVFPALLCTSAGVACIASNQTLSIILVRQLMQNIWQKSEIPRSRQALQLSDSVVTISGLIPWNIACAMPLSMVGVGFGALAYSFLLYLIPLYGLWNYRQK